MKRGILIAILAVLWALPGLAQISVSPGTREEPESFGVRFTTNHAVNTISEPIDACYQMWFVWDQGTAGVVSAYSVERTDDTFSEVEAGTLIRAFSTDGTFGPFTPSDSQVRFVVDTAETSGTSEMKVYCSNELATGGGARVDSDGDGLYEYLRFPFDYDGDGTSAIACTGSETPDPACARAGESVWPDFNDDLNAADDLLAAGGTFDCVGDWILPIRAKTCSGGTIDGHSCNDNADCTGGGTCGWSNDGYADQYSYSSGEPRSSTSTNTARLPAASKAGASYYFGAPDLNGELDGYRSGCWVVNDLGSHPAESVDNGLDTLQTWAFAIGSYREGEPYGDPTFLDSTSNTDVEETFNTGDGSLCLCNTTSCGATETGWVETYLDSGDWIMFGDGSAGPTYVNDGNTAANFPIAQVHGIHASNTCGTANDSRYVYLNVADFDAPSTLSDATVFELDPHTLSQHVSVIGGTWSPQNPFTQNGYGADATLASTCGAWSGGTDATAEANACDTSSMIGMFQGVKHSFRDAAIHHPSAMQFSVFDGQDGCLGCEYRNNYVGPGYAGAGIIDTGTGYSLVDNVLEGCQLHATSSAACIRTLGEGSLLEGNLMRNVGMGECSVDDTPCAVDGDCSSGTCVNYPEKLVRLANGSNQYFRNRHMGITFGDAIVEVTDSDQDFSENVFIGAKTRTGSGFLLGNTSGLSASNVKFTNNRFMYFQSLDAGDDFSNWVSIRDATNISGSGNIFVNSEPSDGAADAPAPIYVGNSAADDMVAELAQQQWTGSILRGYKALFARDDFTVRGGRCTGDYTDDCRNDADCSVATGTCSYELANDASVGTDITVSGNLVQFPPGSKSYERDGLFLNDIGAVLFSELPTCDFETLGWKVVVADSEQCGSDDADFLASCYCNGSAWTAVP